MDDTTVLKQPAIRTWSGSGPIGHGVTRHDVTGERTQQVIKSLENGIGNGNPMQASAEKIWAAAQQFLRSMLNNSEIYNLWFAPLRATTVEGDLLTVQVANEFCEVRLKDNYLDLLREVLALACGRPMENAFRVEANAAGGLGKPAEVMAAGAAAAAEPPTDRAAAREFPFNPKNTFDTFVVGNNNTFAHAAAMAVAQAPGKSYNPLFLYGGVGLGKTHL